MTTPVTPLPPTSLARRWVRVLIGFTVGVGIGLAPYLGVVGVPLFSPLIDLLPRSVRDVAIPLSASVMGILAMMIQWYGWERLRVSGLRRAFMRLAVATVAAWFVFFVVQALTVAQVQVEGGKSVERFVVSLKRQPTCRCPIDMPDSACIKLISFAESEIETCWGDRPVKMARVLLVFAYLLPMAGIGALAGLLVLREAMVRPMRPRRRARAPVRKASQGMKRPSLGNRD